MRKKNQKQLPLMNKNIEHPHAYELQKISEIIDENPIINEWVLQDLVGDKVKTGVSGLHFWQIRVKKGDHI